MKKLLSLVVLMLFYLGASAEGETIYEIDYSTKKGYPFNVMSFVPEWVDGVMTDLGGLYEYAKKDEAERTSDVIVTTDSGVEYYRLDKLPGTGLWHQYLLADGIVTELNGVYIVKAMVKASEATNITVYMGWGLGQDEQVYKSAAISTEWTEVEWVYSGIGGTLCNLVAQPKTAAKIEWKWLNVSPYQKHSVTWQEWLTNDGNSIIPGVTTESKYVGNAETPWPYWALEETDGINANWRSDRAPEICAWSLTMGRNFDDQAQDISLDTPRARPYPSDIEEEGFESNHVFAVHVTQVEPIVGDGEDSYAWSNQFFIQVPRALKAGEQVRIKFRYKAQHACFAGTQWCKNNFVYLFWKAFGDISFTEKWQEFDKIIAIPSDAEGAWSLSFNLCSDGTNGRTPNIFYFDDLSWQSIVLDEGYFVAASNTKTGTNYDFDHAIAFKKDPFDESLIVATVGEVGKEETYVNSLMISTIRGDDNAFKKNTLKPSGNYIGEDNWGEYYESSNAKINLPSAGVWKISVDTETNEINILKIEGDDIPLKPKCATPEISYINGKITFSCETEGATYHYSITNDDCKTGSENNIQLCMTYKVYVYATKEGYNNSDVATREIVVENGQTTLFGDLDKDGKVNVADHVKLSDIIMNQ